MPNPSYMHSPYKRLTWAFKRLEALSDVLSDALNPNEHPVTFDGSFDAKASTFEVSIDTVPEPPWFTGVMVGDVLHNLRSALDNAAWRLVQDGDDPEPDQSKSVSFPICSRPRSYRKREALALPGVKARSLAVIEAAQPYHEQPVGRALAALQRFSNEDKHHDIHTVLVGTGAFELSFQPVDSVIVEEELLWRFTDRPPPLLGEGMPAWRFKLSDLGDDPGVTVSGQVIPYAAFEDRTPVVQHLRVLADAVRELLGQLDDEVATLIAPPDWAPVSM